MLCVTSALAAQVRGYAREIPATAKGKTGRVTLPLIARDATPTVLVTSDDIADALDGEDVERFASR